MATVTIRNLPDEVHQAIRLRAAEHGRSTEAEIREILAQAVTAECRLKIGTELQRFGERTRGVDLDACRSREPIDPASLD